MADDPKWMELALSLARKGEGWTRPNPAVGAVIVRGGKILGLGWHHRAGQPHAEILAIRDAENKKNRLKGSTLYVTLEPCCTHGRTPPCTEAILRAGIARVVVAATDPNPHHAGRAYKVLRKAGVGVTHGILAQESAFLNRSFNRWIVEKRPWVVAKAAMTLDGYLVNPESSSRWLTGEKARKDVHHLRAQCDAILVGAETIRVDDPLLNIRGVKCLHQPLRVVVTKSGELPRRAKIFQPTTGGETLVFQKKSWPVILDDLGKRGVTKLLVEGGGKVFSSLAKGGWIDELQLYFAPVLLQKKHKGIPNAQVLLSLKSQLFEAKKLGSDLKLSLLVLKASRAR